MENFTFKSAMKANKNLKILGSFLESGKITSVKWRKKDGSITTRAVKGLKGKSKFNVKGGQYLLVKDTNSREFKGDKIQYRQINLLGLKAIKQGKRCLYL